MVLGLPHGRGDVAIFSEGFVSFPVPFGELHTEGLAFHSEVCLFGKHHWVILLAGIVT